MLNEKKVEIKQQELKDEAVKQAVGGFKYVDTQVIPQAAAGTTGNKGNKTAEDCG